MMPSLQVMPYFHIGSSYQDIHNPESHHVASRLYITHVVHSYGLRRPLSCMLNKLCKLIFGLHQALYMSIFQYDEHQGEQVPEAIP